MNTPLPANAACERLLVWLGGSLCLGEAVFQISVLSSSCWHTAISIFCNDSRHCHAKDFILILHGYIGLDCRSQWSSSSMPDCSAQRPGIESQLPLWAGVYFKRGVQPKCGVQNEKCGVPRLKNVEFKIAFWSVDSQENH